MTKKGDYDLWQSLVQIVLLVREDDEVIQYYRMMIAEKHL